MRFNPMIKKHNITKTVYSWRFPETDKVYESLDLKVMNKRHQKAWTKKQDSYHDDFYNVWRSWIRPTRLKLPDLDYFYPTNGSSEAIRCVIADLAANYPDACVHVLEGEYEGYEAIARGFGVRVIKHDLGQLRRSLDLCFAERDPEDEGDMFFISHPNSNYGNSLNIKHILNTIEYFGIRCAVDLCYVGCVPEKKWFNGVVGPLNDGYFDLNFDCVSHIFFSLSKVFGVYYNRIGGVICREEVQNLYGNKWFKNLDSMYFGIRLMASYGPFDLPNKYMPIQQAIVDNLQHMVEYANSPEPDYGYPSSIDIYSSDVLLLAHGECTKDLFYGSALEPFTRKSEKFWNSKNRLGQQRDFRTFRLCLTAELDKRVRNGTK